MSQERNYTSKNWWASVTILWTHQDRHVIGIVSAEYSETKSNKLPPRVLNSIVNLIDLLIVASKISRDSWLRVTCTWWQDFEKADIERPRVTMAFIVVASRAVKVFLHNLEITFSHVLIFWCKPYIKLSNGRSTTAQRDVVRCVAVTHANVSAPKVFMRQLSVR